MGYLYIFLYFLDDEKLAEQSQDAQMDTGTQ